MLSGIYKPLIVALGLLSVLFVLLVVNRMDKIDRDEIGTKLKPVAFIKYQAWLLLEIAKSNLAVAKIILSPSLPIRQHMFSVPYTQKTDMGQVIFANSITLTPGTITIETEPDHFLVHAVSYSPEDMQELAKMDSHVCEIEWMEKT